MESELNDIVERIENLNSKLEHCLILLYRIEACVLPVLEEPVSSIIEAENVTKLKRKRT